jgi:hypothetical protein
MLRHKKQLKRGIQNLKLSHPNKTACLFSASTVVPFISPLFIDKPKNGNRIQTVGLTDGFQQA